jgi:crotonobetaine/carnitine-CoA ligase
VFDRSLVLPQLIASHAIEQPDATLLDAVDGEPRSYRTVDESARRWAGLQRSVGVQAGDPVASLLPAVPVAYESWLGVAWLQAIEVPVNSMYRGTMLSYIIGHSEATVAVVSERFLPQLLEVAADLPRLRTVIVADATEPLPELPWQAHDAQALLPTRAVPADLPPPRPRDVACLIYTSGTTGPSKGVLMPWRELYEFAASTPPGLVDRSGAYYSSLPVFHASGKSALYLAALAGSRVAFRETFSVSHFWDDVRRYNCTAAGMVGVMASMLLAAPARPDDSDNPLERVMLGPLMPEIEEFTKRFGLRVTTGYGMTEIGAPLASGGYDIGDWRSCGRARSGYELRVVDDQDEEVPDGVVGELVVRSDEPWMLNSGYWRMPEATAAAWRNGWFHTGDGFRRDADGRFFFVDRMKDAIRRRGENISSFEVERLVLEHPSVVDVAAVPVPSPLGEDDVMVHVVAAPGSELTAEALHADLSRTMPTFMVPRYIELTDALPRTQTFRVRKVELRDRGVSPATFDAETLARV